jgi:hypothetical protein
MLKEKGNGKHVEWEVLSPNAECDVVFHEPAPRPLELNHKKVGLYWNGKPDGDVLLNAIGEVLQRRFTGIKPLWFNPGFPLTQETKKQIAERADVVISAIGD